MRKKFVLLLVLVALLASACGGVQPANQTGSQPLPAEEEATQAPSEEPTEEVDDEASLTFTDDLGRQIELPAYPTRIVATAASVIDILFAVSAGDLVVGRDDYSTYPEEALAVESFGSFFGGVPAEQILAMEPDLVIAAEVISAAQVQEMEDLGLVVYWQANPADFEGLYDNLREVGMLTGHAADAELAAAGLAERIAAVQAKLAGIEEPVSVFYELDGSDPLQPWTTGGGTFIDTIINLAGGVNAAADLEGEYAQISTEVLIVSNPEVILLADAAYGISVESVGQRAGWDVISAVVNGRVHAFDPGLLSVPGTRLVEGFEALAALLHPALFE
ncbi:MAG: ABC transporter substrate-binding protein [Anaerolineae bacterium]|nr:ABC transporter substrate-binding protein [Anaerolineae bacterium]